MNDKALELYLKHVKPFDSKENQITLADACISALAVFQKEFELRKNDGTVNLDKKTLSEIIDALKYYADTENYRSKASVNAGGRLIEQELGDRARRALAALKK